MTGTLAGAGVQLALTQRLQLVIGYLTGIAIAVNHKGRAAVVSLDDVYRKAARTFRVQESKITQATY
jgi:hypothetical protein